MALIQHEYGLHGPDEGTAVLDLVDQIRAPVTTVLHTVLPSPNGHQRRIAAGLADAGAIRAHRNRFALGEHTRLPNHASTSWPARLAAHVATGTFQAAPSPRHLGPARSGQGHRAAASSYVDDPDRAAVTLDIIGQTHPKVLARSGAVVSESAAAACSDLGLASRVRFVDRYLEDGELQRLVSRPMLW